MASAEGASMGVRHSTTEPQDLMQEKQGTDHLLSSN